MFAVLGCALVRPATVEPSGTVWTALSAVVVVAAAVTLFGVGAVRTALRVLGR